MTIVDVFFAYIFGCMIGGVISAIIIMLSPEEVNDEGC